MNGRSANGDPAGPRILVMGVGGGGCNTVSHVAMDLLSDADIVAVHTDSQALSTCEGVRRFQLGANVMHGVSAAGDAGLGRRAAEVDAKQLTRMLEDVDLLFLVGGFGGGTGTGAIPAIAKMARNVGAVTLCFVTLPFEFEGHERMRQAEMGVEELRRAADVVVTFPNQRLFDLVDQSANLTSAFRQVDRAVGVCIRSIWNLLTQVGVMNLDFADFKKLMTSSGDLCAMGHVECDGEDRAREAVKGILNSPFFESGRMIADASTLLVGIVGGEDVTLHEIQEVMRGITGMAREDVQVVMGTAVDSRYDSTLALTVLASLDQNGAAGKRKVVEEPERKKEEPVEKKGRKRGGKKKAEQTKLALDGGSKGRFKDVDPTIYDGEDLDIPTFIRRGIRLSK